jgi:hypothetical protein
MALTLADLRKQRTSDFSNITAALTKKTEYAKDDEGFWKLTRDKAGNGSAVIRFLPKHADDELPWVQIYSHAFKNSSGKWFIDNCPTTIGGECPVCELNRGSYQSLSKEEATKIAGPRKRKLSYIANIVVLKDPAAPENDGKVFRFKFGKKIHDMILDKAQPTFEDDKPVNIFDLWDGADFRLRQHMADNYPSYDKSSFGDVKPLSENDEEILAFVNQQVSLSPFVAADKFKSHADLTKRLNGVMDTAVASTAKAEEMVREIRESVKTEAVKAPKEVKAPVVAAKAEAGADDDLEAYFRDLAE